MKVECAYDELVELHKLQPNPRNPNKHPEKQIEMLAKIIDYQGQRSPIVVSKRSGFVTKGHGRLAALQKLGWEKAAVDFQEYDSEAQEHADMIADNKIAELADSDPLMINELALEMPEGFDFELLGIEDFNPVETNVLNEELEDEVPNVPKDTIIKLGDVIELGNHRLMCGDSTSIDAVEKLMNGEKADMVFTDPPYGIDIVQSNSVGGGGPTKFGTVGSGKIVPAKTYRKIEGDETTECAKDFYNMCVGFGFENIVLWGGNYFTDFLPPSRCWLVWDKEMTGNFSQAEMAWTSLTVGGVRVFKFLWNGLSREGNRKDELKGRVHPTQKPVGLFSQVFDRLDKFQSVFDGFGGSGSTLIACEKTNRKCFMMELDPHYCDVIVSRWLKYTNKTKIKLNGETTEWKLNG